MFRWETKEPTLREEARQEADGFGVRARPTWTEHPAYTEKRAQTDAAYDKFADEQARANVVGAAVMMAGGGVVLTLLTLLIRALWLTLRTWPH